MSTDIVQLKIGADAARQQLDVLYDYYEIDFDDMPKHNAEVLKATDRKLLKAIRKGRIEISLDDKDVVKVVQYIKGGGEPLVYREIDGTAKIAMSSEAENDSYGKAYALMGSLCGIGKTAITQLKSRDLSVVECLGVVFLQA